MDKVVSWMKCLFKNEVWPFFNKKINTLNRLLYTCHHHVLCKVFVGLIVTILQTCQTDGMNFECYSTQKISNQERQSRNDFISFKLLFYHGFYASNLFSH